MNKYIVIGVFVLIVVGGLWYFKQSNVPAVSVKQQNQSIDQPSNSQTISAAVVSGSAPFTVKFSVAYMELGSYWVEFGDGQQAGVTCSAYKPDSDICVIFNNTISHTYLQPGVYTVKYMERSYDAIESETKAIGFVVITVK